MPFLRARSMRKRYRTNKTQSPRATASLFPLGCFGSFPITSSFERSVLFEFDVEDGEESLLICTIRFIRLRFLRSPPSYSWKQRNEQCDAACLLWMETWIKFINTRHQCDVCPQKVFVDSLVCPFDHTLYVSVIAVSSSASTWMNGFVVLMSLASFRCEDHSACQRSFCAVSNTQSFPSLRDNGTKNWTVTPTLPSASITVFQLWGRDAFSRNKGPSARALIIC